MSPSVGIRISVILALSNFFNSCLILNADKCLHYAAGGCKCRYNNGSVVDLTSISPKGKPLFKDVKATGPHNETLEYSYNPCFEFKEGDSDCKDGVTVCLKQKSHEYAAGQAKDMEFQYDEANNQLFLLYKRDERKTIVTLICSRNVEKPQFEVLKEPDPGFSKLYLKLTTVCACPDGCIEESSGLSTGSVLLVLLFVFSAVYFFGGMLYLKFGRGASGTEIIPNYDFWVDFPLLVRDGVVFLFNCCRAETTYERI